LRLLRSLLNTHLFTRSSPLVSAFDVILWWETRRLPFNLIVGITGVVTCAAILVLVIMASSMITFPESTDPAADGPEPILAVILVIAYGVGANVCYTGGWIAEIIARRLWGDKAAHFGEISFGLGLAFSVVLTLVPIPITALILVMVGLSIP
jgi:hypothetical protein